METLENEGVRTSMEADRVGDVIFPGTVIAADGVPLVVSVEPDFRCAFPDGVTIEPGSSWYEKIRVKRIIL